MKLIKLQSDNLLDIEDYYTKVVYKSNDYELAENEELVLDITCILELFEINRYDMMEMRSYMKNYILPNWESLSSDDKLELERLFIYPAEHIFSINEDEQLSYWKILVNIEKECRIKRIEETKQVVSFYFSREESYEIFTDTKDLFRDWIDAETPFLYQWVTDTETYVNTGISSKLYYTEYRKNLILDTLFK